MSTAIMSQNAMYEFGDSLMKSGMSDPSSPPPNGGGALQHAVHLTLSRMQSAPAGHPANQQAQLAVLLGNLTQHHHHHHHHHQHRRLERTQSAPAPQQQQPPPLPASAVQQQPTAANTSRYKTELCRPFEEFGVCKYGDKCQFAHGHAELRSLARHPKYKTELCRTYHTVGFCPYGPRCHFVHNQDEVAQKAPVTANHSAVAAAAAILTRTAPQTTAGAGIGRPRPAALSPSLSLDSPSPPCSLSQSPASSMGSFFSSEPELHSPGAVEDARLPVFNRLIDAAQLLSLSDLML